jgi:hypothetical protein
MELQGRIVKMLPLQEGVSQSSGNPWKKQEFLFGFFESSDSIYEKRIKLDIMNDKINELGLQEGDEIKVRLSLGCREYPKDSGKYFNDIRTGEITILKRADAKVPQQPAVGVSTAPATNTPQPQQNAPSAPANEQADDLPF